MSLSTKVLLLVLTVTVVTSAVVAWVVTMNVTEHETGRAGVAISDAIGRYLARVQTRHEQTSAYVRALLDSPAVRSYLAAADEPGPEGQAAVQNLREQMLGREVSSELGARGVPVAFHVLVNSLGQVLLAAAPQQPDLEPTLAEQARSWRPDAVMEDRQLVRDYARTPAGLFLVLGVPLRTLAGEAPTHAYFVGVRVDDAWVRSQLLSTDGGRLAVPLSAWFLVDGAVVASGSSDGRTPGTPVLPPPPGRGPTTGVARSDARTAFDVNGERFIGQAVALAEGTSDQLVLGSSIDAALAPLRGLQRQIVLITLGACAAAVIAARTVARLISRPVEEMVEATGRIGAGRFDAPIPVRRRDELGVLATSLNDMAQGLADREKLREDRVKLDRDLAVARSIQMATLPRALPSVAGYELAAMARPAEQTGGDTYDVLELHDEPLGRDRAIGILLADATGHGIGAALSVTQVRAMLRIGVRLRALMGDVLQQMNRQLCDDLDGTRFVTAFLGRLDPEAHRLDFYAAGQGPILHLCAARGECKSHDATTLPLGILDVPPDDGVKTIHLADGDVVALLTDGFYEYSNGHGELFGAERVVEVLKGNVHRPAQELLDALLRAVEAFAGGAKQADDMTAVIIKRGTGGNS